MARPDHAAEANPSPASDHSWRRTFDFVMVVVVLLFAFLAASFAVRNSDFWMHLAGGRLLAEGHYRFGIDPFAYTTSDVYWANHAWLFDLLLFLLHKQFGGPALVIVKALLIAVLAAFLLSVRRPGGRLGLPALCTLLAVLAMSPRLLLHSTLLSYVLLGLTLWLLWRPYRGSNTFRQQLRHYTPLMLLFVLWVNVDGWFLLGPLLAALFWLGDWIAPARGEGAAPWRTPFWLWLLGLALLVLNPHHVETSMLPAELMPLPAALRHDFRFQPLHASPWRMHLYYHPLAGVNWASAAYLVLLIAGALSFLLNGRNLAGWRLFVWLTFAGLSAWLVRAIPFFAIVAGPITALNLQDYLSRRSTADPSEGVGRRLGRAGVLVVGLELIFLAWPGWLQGFQDNGRHVAWVVQPDGSLRRVAETLHDWHTQGKLGEGRGFLSHPSLVHYCAWFCPEEKGFLDRRLELFRGLADQYEEICRALNPALAPPESKPNHFERALFRGDEPNGYWRKPLRDWGVTHLVLYDSSLPRLSPALKQLTGDKGDWTLLHIDGLALIVGWKDGDRRVPAGLPAFDADRVAFAPSGPEDERMLPPTPGRGTAREPRVADFWSHFGSPVPPPSWETDAAGVLIHYFEDRAARQFQQRATRCFGWAAALPGSPALSAGSVDGSVRLVIQLDRMPLALGDLGQRSSAAPLLAVRAARRALADNPDDGNAYLYLGRAYLALAGLTPERTVLGSFQPLARLRHIQIAAALENALRRNPDLEPAHEDLANLYVRRNFLDAALEHRRAAGRLTRRTGPVGGETAEAFAGRLEQMEAGTNELEREVGDRRNRFTLQAQTMGSQPYRKAQLALRMGLVRLALEDILMQSSMVLLGGEGVALQLELQLMLGRIEPVRAQLHHPDWQANKKNLGYLDLHGGADSTAAPAYRLPAYDWLLLCQAAAVGDYEQADDALQALRDGMGGQRVEGNLRRLQRDMPRALALELALAASRPSWMPRQLTRENRLLMTELLTALSFVVTKQADLYVLSGMLSLERGLPRSAEESFGTALTLSRLGSVSAGQPLAKAYLQLIRATRR